MAFNPTNSSYGVPGSTLSDWVPLRSPTNSSLTTWYHPSTKRMVDYNSTRNTGTTVNTGTTRRTQVENTFGSAIRSADQRTSAAAVTSDRVTGSSVLSSENLRQTGANVSRGSYNTSYYPESLATTKQDRIKFAMKKAGTRNLTQSNPAAGTLSGFTTRTSGESLGEVYLAIPSQITDSNSADWSGSTMNPLQATMASIAIGAMKGSGKRDLIEDLASSAGKLAGDVAKNLKAFASERGNRDAMQILLAQEAVQSQGLLSRLSGAVANPNLELLFNGPSLRPFSFTFRLAPRNSSEALQVKRIIRFFKEGMAVQTTDQDVFLKSPNVFDIQFQSGAETTPHKSLPRIKTCALIGCDVDYTPDGSYMTFNDEAQGYPMTCYQLTLRFSELEPVYAKDYQVQGLGQDDIGY